MTLKIGQHVVDDSVRPPMEGRIVGFASNKYGRDLKVKVEFKMWFGTKTAWTSECHVYPVTEVQ